MFIVYWLFAVAFGVVSACDPSLFGIWFLCCLGCFILGLVDLIKGGY